MSEYKPERNARIRERAASGDTYAVLAREYGITRARVHQIVSRRNDGPPRNGTVQPEPTGEFAALVSALSRACTAADSNGVRLVVLPVEVVESAVHALTSKRAPLTSAQFAVYSAVRDLSTTGFAPSHSEIATRLGLRSLATITEHLDRLEQKGYIARPAGRGKAKRNVVLVEPVLC